MKKFLDYIFWNNTVYSWLFALGIVVVSVIIIRLFRRVVLKCLKNWTAHTSATWDDILVIGIDKLVVPIFYVSTVFFAVKTLALTPGATKIVHVAYMAALTFCSLRLASAIVRRLLTTFISHRDEQSQAAQSVSGLSIIISIVIWMIGIIFLIDNLGYSVTTLVTGLGIGGVAVALAAQTILGDLFSYFAIFFDKPFEIGDSITIGDQSGTVEKIGIKTTRIRTVNGDQLICSNSDLTNSRVNNFKRLENRSIVFNLRVVYSTPPETLDAIPGIVEAIIDEQEHVSFGRGHLAVLNESSLDFEFVYNVLSPEYRVYMDVQHAIYVRIVKTFKEREIHFAYPTRKLFVEEDKPDMDTPALKNS